MEVNDKLKIIIYHEEMLFDWNLVSQEIYLHIFNLKYFCRMPDVKYWKQRKPEGLIRWLNYSKRIVNGTPRVIAFETAPFVSKLNWLVTQTMKLK